MDVLSALVSRAGCLSIAPIARKSQVFGSSPTFEPAIELGVEPGRVKCAIDDTSNYTGLHNRTPIVQPTNHINAFRCSDLFGCWQASQFFLQTNQSCDNLINVQKSVPTKKNRWKKQRKSGVDPALSRKCDEIIQSLSQNARRYPKPVLFRLRGIDDR